MTAAPMAALAPPPVARAAETIWCLVCRGFRPYRSAPVPKASRFHVDGFDTDHLICAGCATTLMTVRALQEVS